MFLREAMLLVADLVAAGALALVLQAGRARRRLARARSAARFLFRDVWLTLFCA
jgi:hypothetical protein